MPLVTRVCSKCLERKPLRTHFIPDPRYRLGYTRQCRKCHSKNCVKSAQKSSKKSTPQQRMWTSSKLNAKAKGVEHTIKVSDIPVPKHCRYFGVLLDYRRASERGTLRAWNAPSIDRIDPSRGYVPGNIQTISDLANRMKQNATIPQLIAFAKGVLRAHDTPDA